MRNARQGHQQSRVPVKKTIVFILDFIGTSNCAEGETEVGKTASQKVSKDALSVHLETREVGGKERGDNLPKVTTWAPDFFDRGWGGALGALPVSLCPSLPILDMHSLGGGQPRQISSEVESPIADEESHCSST